MPSGNLAALLDGVDPAELRQQLELARTAIEQCGLAPDAPLIAVLSRLAAVLPPASSAGDGSGLLEPPGGGSSRTGSSSDTPHSHPPLPTSSAPPPSPARADEEPIAESDAASGATQSVCALKPGGSASLMPPAPSGALASGSHVSQSTPSASHSAADAAIPVDNTAAVSAGAASNASGAGAVLGALQQPRARRQLYTELPIPPCEMDRLEDVRAARRAPCTAQPRFRRPSHPCPRPALAWAVRSLKPLCSAPSPAAPTPARRADRL